MCGVCLENIVFMYIKDEMKNKKLCKDIVIYSNYAQETSFLKELLNYLNKNSDVLDVLPIFCMRAIEDTLSHKQIDYFIFDEEILSSYFSKIQLDFENFQKKLPWMKFWKPLYEKESFSSLKVIKNFLSSSKIKDYAKNCVKLLSTKIYSPIRNRRSS